MFEADTITAERKNRSALSFWRVVAILALMVGFVSLYIANSKNDGGIVRFSDHVARVYITGLITGDRHTVKLLKKLKKSDRVKAVIIRINSPGGTTVGSEALYDAIREIGKNKPVVAVMDSVAASGGYIIALGSDHIVARGNSITGSIGVIFQWPEVAGLMDKIGIKMNTIKSGPQKAEPDIYQPLREDVRKVLEESVTDSFNWFVSLVAERRKLDRDIVMKLADGRVYTGRQALKNALIDEIGGETRALAWLKKTKKVDKSLKVQTWTITKPTQKIGITLAAIRTGLRTFGLEQLAENLDPTRTADIRRLDGLLAVWQPAIK